MAEILGILGEADLEADLAWLAQFRASFGHKPVARDTLVGMLHEVDETADTIEREGTLTHEALVKIRSRHSWRDGTEVAERGFGWTPPKRIIVPVRAKTKSGAGRRMAGAVLLEYQDDDAAPFGGNQVETPPPPYLLFQHWLSVDLGGERANSMKISDLEAEIWRRWPADRLGPPSKRMIRVMATMLRSLKAKRGGAKQQRRPPRS